MGAAALNAVSLAIITGAFSPQQRGAAVSIWGALAGLAAAVGPVLGGLLLSLPVAHLGGPTIASWRWIFLINLPFCAAGLLLVERTVPETRDEEVSAHVDGVGLASLSVGMISLALAIIQGNDWHWDGRIVILFLVAAGAFVSFVWYEGRQAEPLVDLRLFQIRSFTAANGGMFLFGVAAQGAFLLVVLYFITAQGTTQLGAAYAFLPMPLAAFVVSAIVSPLSRKIPPKTLAMAGLAVFALGFWAFATIPAMANGWAPSWRAILLGIGLGLCYSSLPAMVLADIPPTRYGVASGTFNTFRQFGFVLGVAVLISLLNGQLTQQTHLAQQAARQEIQVTTTVPAATKTRLINALTAWPALAGHLTPQEQQAPLVRHITQRFHQATVTAFTVCWSLCALIALAGLLLVGFASPSATGAGRLAAEGSGREQGARAGLGR